MASKAGPSAALRSGRDDSLVIDDSCGDVASYVSDCWQSGL